MSSSIYVRVSNGLGNQLFQYALGRALSIRHQANLKLDLDWFEDDSERDFRLNKFNICADVASDSELRNYFGRRSGANYQSLAFRLRERCVPVGAKKLISESGFDVDHRVFEARPPVYLDGYWQSARYFSEIESQLKAELTLKQDCVSNIADPLSQVRAANSICVHVRRGDYVTNNAYRAIHGACTPEYYERGAELLCQNLYDPVLYVFSDDPVWAKATLELPGRVVWASGDGKRRDYEDFALMCACRHFLIANSSFSWWAAWLGDSKGKTVIAPRKWFRTNARNTKDLYPDGWIVI